MAFLKNENGPSRKEQKQLEKEQRQQEKEQALLLRYGMDILSDPRDIQAVRDIASALAGTGLIETGTLLGGGNEKDLLKINNDYAKVIMQQNFILIRQMERMNRNLELIRNPVPPQQW